MEAGEVGGVGGGIRSGCRQYPEIDVGTPELLKCEILKLAYARADNKAINNIYNGVRPADASGKWGGPACRIIARQLNENGLPDFKDCNNLPKGLEEDLKPDDNSGDIEDKQSSDEEGGKEEDDDKEDDDKEDDDADNLACDKPGVPQYVDVWGPPGSQPLAWIGDGHSAFFKSLRDWSCSRITSGIDYQRSCDLPPDYKMGKSETLSPGYIQWRGWE